VPVVQAECVKYVCRRMVSLTPLGPFKSRTPRHTTGPGTARFRGQAFSGDPLAQVGASSAYLPRPLRRQAPDHLLHRRWRRGRRILLHLGLDSVARRSREPRHRRTSANSALTTTASTLPTPTESPPPSSVRPCPALVPGAYPLPGRAVHRPDLGRLPKDLVAAARQALAVDRALVKIADERAGAARARAAQRIES
jgi:hypothetical protein